MTTKITIVGHKESFLHPNFKTVKEYAAVVLEPITERLLTISDVSVHKVQTAHHT